MLLQEQQEGHNLFLNIQVLRCQKIASESETFCYFASSSLSVSERAVLSQRSCDETLQFNLTQLNSTQLKLINHTTPNYSYTTVHCTYTNNEVAITVTVTVTVTIAIAIAITITVTITITITIHCTTLIVTSLRLFLTLKTP